MDEQVTPEDQTVPIYDISGEKPALGHVPHEDVQQAVISGNYSLPKGRDVQVISPEGSLGTVPAEDAPEAFKNGYQYATPKLITAHEEKQHYESFPQQALGTAEALGRGIAGPLVPLAEKGLTKLGVEGLTPEAQRKREEGLGLAAPLAEAAAFAGSMFTGVGEAALLGKAGEAAAAALKLGGEGANITSRLAAGATRMATEMGLFQAGDEASKIINDVPTTPGQVASNIGLSALIGGIGGGALSGISEGAKKLVNNQLIKDFADRMAFRGSNVAPEEMLQHEVTEAVNSFHQIGTEVGGVSGLKAQAIQAALPETITPEIATHMQDVATRAEGALANMVREDVPARLARDFQGVTNRFMEVATNPEASVAQRFDAVNQFKNDLQDYAKGRYGLHAIQRTAEDYQFVNITKNLARDVRLSLENPEIWGQAANVQKEINAAWKATLPYVDQVTKGFMSKVGDEYVVDPAKFKSFLSQSARSGTETIRQQRLGKFLEGLEKFHDTAASVSERAGIENPIGPISMTQLKDAAKTPSIGAKLADHWFDRLGPTGLGEVAGGATGAAIGHGTGIPEMGFLGGYLGKWTLGPVFSSIIKPILQHGPNIPAVRAATGYTKALLEGNAALTNAAGKLFKSGAETIPSHYMPTEKDVKKLDEQVKGAALNPAHLLNVASNMEDYMPGHAQALSQTTMTAVTYLNGLRPQSVKAAPLDKEIEPSKAQRAAYTRQLEIAQQPLMVFQHMKEGTLQPADIKTLQTIYPDYYNKMSQEVMTAMTDHISKGENVPYKLRQSASLFLGQPLDSTMTPSSIQAIQSHYLAKAPQQQQAQQMTKKGTSKLGQVSKNMLTMNQSRAQRAEKA